MTQRRTIIPAALRGVYEQWRYAPAVAANGFIHVCGIVGVSPGGATPEWLGKESNQTFAGASSKPPNETCGMACSCLHSDN